MQRKKTNMLRISALILVSMFVVAAMGLSFAQEPGLAKVVFLVH